MLFPLALFYRFEVFPDPAHKHDGFDAGWKNAGSGIRNRHWKVESESFIRIFFRDYPVPEIPISVANEFG